MNKTSGRILYVEDNELLSIVTTDVLTRAGYEVDHSESGSEAWEKFCARPPYDLLATDLNLPGISGAELVKLVAAKSPQFTVVVMSAFLSSEARKELKSFGVRYFLEKPVSSEKLLQMIAKALSGSKLETST